MTDTSKYYVFYDGDCGFCNYWVQWILENDKKDLFLFAALQSEFGQQFLKERNLENKQFSTLYLWRPNYYYLKKSEAVTKIAKLLGGKYAVLSHLNFLPRSISDFFYDKISENRMKLSSQKCFLPKESHKNKFV